MLGSYRATRAALAVALLLAAGCSNTPPPLPKTYPVTGVVLDHAGQPLQGGTIQFQSAEDPLLRVLGQIQKDGAFTLRTLKDNARATGAPAGEYKVIVQPPREEVIINDQKIPHRGVPAISLTDKYKVEAKDNTFRIVLPATPASP